MSLKASFEFLFVGRDENSFLECYSYDLFEEHGEGSGQIFINLEIQNNPVDAEEIGTVLFDAVRTVFFEDMEKDGNSRFEAALKAANKALNDFKATKATEYLGNLNVIVAAVLGDQLFLSQSGDSEAYLVRKKFVSVVSEGLSEDQAEDEIFSSIASGNIESGDFVLFSSARLLRYIGKTDLAACVNRRGLPETLAAIQDVISTEILGRLGFTGIMFSKPTAAETAEIEEMSEHENQVTSSSSRNRRVVSRETFVGKFIATAKKYRNRVDGSGMFSRLKSGLFSKNFSKDKILASLVVVIVVLIVGVFIASGHRAQREEIDRLDTILQSVQDRIAEAQTKAALDKEVAKDLLDQAYLDAKSVLDSGVYREKATLLLMDIETTLDSLDNVERIESPVVAADLTAKDPEVNALGFAVVNDRMFVFETDSIFEVLVDAVSDPVVLDEDEVMIAGSGFEDQNSVVFLTQSGKLIQYEDGNVTFMDTDDGTFRKGVAIADFGSRIYLLDDTEGQVWRYGYQGTRDKFGSADEYIVDEIELSNVKDLAIDGGLYVLSGDGDITRFYAGEKQDFFINNPPFNSFIDPTKIYTTDELSEVYVLDGSEKKVFVFLKDTRTGDLVYESQYLFDSASELRDIYVDSKTQTLFVLSSDTVYRLAL